MDDVCCEKLKGYAANLAGLGGVGCRLWQSGAEADGFCAQCGYSRCVPDNTHAFGLAEGARWGGRYIYYCPLGLVFAASPCPACGDSSYAGLIAGPAVVGETEDTLAALPKRELEDKVRELPNIAPPRMTDIAELMAAATAAAADAAHAGMLPAREQQLKALYEVRAMLGDSAAASKKLLDDEKALPRLVAERDRPGFSALLNEILGEIFFAGNADIDITKARLAELIVIMSRAAIDAGADMDEILSGNSGNIKALFSHSAIEELSVWAAEVMHNYIRHTFDFAPARYSNAIYKTTDFVRRHCDEKLTLDGLAKHVCLSRTYLSRMFKEETGESLTVYINRMRVERAKTLLTATALGLAEISGLCGFDDQSYFTRVFKAVTGVPPKRYRDSRGRIGDR